MAKFVTKNPEIDFLLACSLWQCLINPIFVISSAVNSWIQSPSLQIKKHMPQNDEFIQYEWEEMCDVLLCEGGIVRLGKSDDEPGFAWEGAGEEMKWNL